MRPWLTLLIVLLGLPLSAGAELVTVEFEGIVTESFDDADLLPDIAPGASFSGSYTFDDSVPAGPCPPGLGGIGGGGGQLTIDQCAEYSSADFPDAGIGFEIEGNEFTFSNSEQPDVPLTILVVDSETDSYSLRWRRQFPPEEATAKNLVPPKVPPEMPGFQETGRDRMRLRSQDLSVIPDS